MVDPVALPVRVGGLLIVVVETPSGSGTKIKFDPDLGVYRLDRTLPAGMTFPFEFGFVPRTTAADGDPLDAIVFVDAPLFAGCVVKGRLIGVLQLEQQDGGKGPWVRNDRLLVVPAELKGHADARSVRDLDPFRLKALPAFFANYHALDGDNVRFVGYGTVRDAEAAIRSGRAAYGKANGEASRNRA